MNTLDQTELSLDAEEALLRAALHAAVQSGKTASVGPLLAAQTTLRNCGLRLESFVVYDRRKLQAPLYALVDRIEQLCRTKKIPYGSQDCKNRIRDLIEAARNLEGEPLKQSDRKRSKLLPDAAAGS